MSEITGNQERNFFVLGQIAESVGDYFVRIRRSEEAIEEYEEAIRAYKLVPDACPDFAEAQKHLAIVRGYLDKLPGRNKRELSQPSPVLKHGRQDIGTWVKDSLENWRDMLWIPQWAGQPVGAAAVPKQTYLFKMGPIGEIRLDCYWKNEDNSNPAYVWISWKAEIIPGIGLRVRFVSPESQDVLYERSLGTRLTGEGIFTSRELGFDPSSVPWAVVIIPEEVR
jgi:hypothetical protein